jgi:hypothetical protein
MTFTQNRWQPGLLSGLLDVATPLPIVKVVMWHLAQFCSHCAKID